MCLNAHFNDFYPIRSRDNNLMEIISLLLPFKLVSIIFIKNHSENGNLKKDYKQILICE